MTLTMDDIRAVDCCTYHKSQGFVCALPLSGGCDQCLYRVVMFIRATDGFQLTSEKGLSK